MPVDIVSHAICIAPKIVPTIQLRHTEIKEHDTACFELEKQCDNKLYNILERSVRFIDVNTVSSIYGIAELVPLGLEPFCAV